MKRLILRALSVALVATGFGLGFDTTQVYAAHGSTPQKKVAILLVAFGTTVPEAQRAFDQIEARAREAFPNTEIRWAFTSRIVRKKLGEAGKKLDSPETALARLMDEGFTHVAILSLHTIPGIEFHDLYENAKLFQQMAGGFEKVAVAWPLLASHDDMVATAKAILQSLPPERKPEDPVVLMGHGTEKHPSDALYLAMNQVFQQLDPRVFLATVEGYPGIQDVLERLKQESGRKVYLMPFMAVAGDHARKDMAGKEPDSWKSILEKNGFQCEVVLKGTGEIPGVVDVWLSHLKTVIRFQEGPQTGRGQG